MWPPTAGRESLICKCNPVAYSYMTHLFHPSNPIERSKKSAKTMPRHHATPKQATALATNGCPHFNGNFRHPQARGTPIHPCYSHSTPIFESLEVWEWYGKLIGRGSHYCGSLEKSLIISLICWLDWLAKKIKPNFPQLVMNPRLKV